MSETIPKDETDFYVWWEENYSMANLAMGAAEAAWNAATERAAKIADQIAAERHEQSFLVAGRIKQMGLSAQAFIAESIASAIRDRSKT